MAVVDECSQNGIGRGAWVHAAALTVRLETKHIPLDKCLATAAYSVFICTTINIINYITILKLIK